MSEQKKRIGILGGTFDPIHYGHLLIAENAAAQYLLDEVWFMPTGNSPHKQQKDITDTEHRCAMIQLAIQDNDCFQLSRFEADSVETNYTYRTISYLTQHFPELDFYFIMGGDSLQNFENWRNPEQILKMVHILAAIREDMEGEEFYQQISYLNEKYTARGVHALCTPNYSISSRNIRQLVAKQRTVRYMLPENVRAYIITHKLYEEKQDR